jgi:hypothetical protein
MKIGNVYFYQTETKMFVPLLDENLEGDVFGLFIEVKSTDKNFYDCPEFNQFKKPYEYTNTKKVLPLLDEMYKNKQIRFGFIKKNQVSSLRSTYIASNKAWVYVGDKFEKVISTTSSTMGKVFTMLGLVKHEDYIDFETRKPSSILGYPLGIDFTDLTTYVSGLALSKLGLEQILVGDAVKDIYAEKLFDILKTNTELAFWSINNPRPYNIVIYKQDKPEFTRSMLEFEVALSKSEEKTAKVVKEALGEEIDEDFAKKIGSLDWDVLTKLKKKNPKILAQVSTILGKIYDSYLQDKLSKQKALQEQREEELRIKKAELSLEYIDEDGTIDGIPFSWFDSQYIKDFKVENGHLVKTKEGLNQFLFYAVTSPQKAHMWCFYDFYCFDRIINNPLVTKDDRVIIPNTNYFKAVEDGLIKNGEGVYVAIMRKEFTQMMQISNLPKYIKLNVSYNLMKDVRLVQKRQEIFELTPAKEYVDGFVKSTITDDLDWSMWQDMFERGLQSTITKNLIRYGVIDENTLDLKDKTIDDALFNELGLVDGASKYDISRNIDKYEFIRILNKKRLSESDKINLFYAMYDIYTFDKTSYLFNQALKEGMVKSEDDVIVRFKLRDYFKRKDVEKIFTTDFLQLQTYLSKIPDSLYARVEAVGTYIVKKLFSELQKNLDLALVRLDNNKGSLAIQLATGRKNGIFPLNFSDHYGGYYSVASLDKNYVIDLIYRVYNNIDNVWKDKEEQKTFFFLFLSFSIGSSKISYEFEKGVIAQLYSKDSIVIRTNGFVNTDKSFKTIEETDFLQLKTAVNNKQIVYENMNIDEAMKKHYETLYPELVNEVSNILMYQGWEALLPHIYPIVKVEDYKETLKVVFGESAIAPPDIRLIDYSTPTTLLSGDETPILPKKDIQEIEKKYESIEFDF